MNHEAIGRAVVIYRVFLQENHVRRAANVSHSTRKVMGRAGIGWAHVMLDGVEEATRLGDHVSANWLIGFVQGMLWTIGLATLDELRAQSVTALGPHSVPPAIRMEDLPNLDGIERSCLEWLAEQRRTPAKCGLFGEAVSPAEVLEHAGWMFGEIRGFIAAGHLSKACRWLGFAQACFWANGAFSFMESLAHHPPFI